MSKRLQYPVITFDGASGTGKGTISHLLARKLGWNILDSGALYRSLALAISEQQLDPNNINAIVTLAHGLNITFELDNNIKTISNGRDVSDLIRTEDIGTLASKIAQTPEVRAALLVKQRALRTAPGLIADGRDMGTVVFPDAVLKFFLIATPEERAKRRFKQLKTMGISVNLSALVDELKARDLRDQTRAVAPLRPARDALSIDVTGLTIDETFNCVMSEVQRVI